MAAFLKEKGLADKKFQVVGRGEAFGDTKDSLVGTVLQGESAADRRVEVIHLPLRQAPRAPSARRLRGPEPGRRRPN